MDMKDIKTVYQSDGTVSLFYKEYCYRYKREVDCEYNFGYVDGRLIDFDQIMIFGGRLFAGVTSCDEDH